MILFAPKRHRHHQDRKMARLESVSTRCGICHTLNEWGRFVRSLKPRLIATRRTKWEGRKTTKNNEKKKQPCNVRFFNAAPSSFLFAHQS